MAVAVEQLCDILDIGPDPLEGVAFFFYAC